MAPNAGMEIGVVRVNVDTVWCPWAGDLSEAKTPIEAIKITLPPAASSPSHLLQQFHITIGHSSSGHLSSPIFPRRECSLGTAGSQADDECAQNGGYGGAGEQERT